MTAPTAFTGSAHDIAGKTFPKDVFHTNVYRALTQTGQSLKIQATQNKRPRLTSHSIGAALSMTGKEVFIPPRYFCGVPRWGRWPSNPCDGGSSPPLSTNSIVSRTTTELKTQTVTIPTQLYTLPITGEESGKHKQYNQRHEGN